MCNVIVVGGGAAGMMAAVCAAEAGAHVTLMERNEKLGKKLYITGKGRCNVTNAADRDMFFASIPRNPRFLYAAFSHMNNLDWMEKLESWGVPLKVERGERVFPQSDHASDVTRAFDYRLHELGVRTILMCHVEEVVVEGGHVTGVRVSNGTFFPCDALILATGGLSYPSTGSTGDGHRFAEETGHRMKKALPSLVPIETVETWPTLLTGLSLKNVALSAFGKKGKMIFHEQGEMLFTHFGISGPLVLTLSSLLDEEPAGTKLEIDLKPALDDETLDKRLLREFASAPNRRVLSVAETLEPRALAAEVVRLAGVSPALAVNSVTRAQRGSLLRTLKHLPLTVKALRPLSEAIITRGGVDVRDIDPSTMASKKLAGLYFAGELMDVDAFTGGFNLQIAFSTGALAGASSALPRGQGLLAPAPSPKGPVPLETHSSLPRDGLRGEG